MHRRVLAWKIGCLSIPTTYISTCKLLWTRGQFLITRFESKSGRDRGNVAAVLPLQFYLNTHLYIDPCVARDTRGLLLPTSHVQNKKGG